jgi:hypothetical protein
MTSQLVKIWLWMSALASAAGWILSVVGKLNRVGYVLFALAGLIALWLCRNSLELNLWIRASDLKKLKSHFTRPLPRAFALLAFLILLGAVVYPPTNHTGLSYRLPRVLQWLAHDRWLWIHTENYRMNDRANGMEWLTAPFLLFGRSDRFLFLLNFIPFLLLPGQIFSVWTRLGVRPRVAWVWMWLLPTGYSFLLQAGSIGNDTFPTIYALAMMEFACRAWMSRRTSDLWHAMLAAALLTGAKASNLPLLLPVAILILPLARLLLRKPAGTVAIFSLGTLVSFLPMALLNYHYCGDWSGAKLEPPGMTVKDPVIGLWGNAFQLLLNNFAPPLFPQAGWWNQHASTLLPHGFVTTAEANFDTGFFWLGELPTEDWAGLGFGVSILVTVCVLASFAIRVRPPSFAPATRSIPRGLLRWVLLAPWIALMAYCAKSGMVTAARLISPFYPLLLPLLLVSPAQSELIRRRWWHMLMWGNLLVALLVLALTPARPLWPAKTILAKARAARPEQPLLARAEKVYAVYAGRSDPLANVRALLPPGIQIIGFVGGPDEIDVSLWRPYGATRVEHILLGDSPESIRQRKIEYAVVGGFLFESDAAFAAWLQTSGAELIATTNALVKIHAGVQSWHVVRFK